MNQELISIKQLFRGFMVKNQVRGQIILESMNMIINKDKYCAEYYYKCQMDRCKVLNDSPVQRVRMVKQHKNYIKINTAYAYNLKRHVECIKLDLNVVRTKTIKE